MSYSGPIDLPSPTGGGTHYSKSLLSAYLRLTNPTRIRQDISQFGYFLARGESDDHELIALEELKSKLNDVLSGEVEARKNSWVNSINRNLRNGDDKAVASMLASVWRRYLSETSLRKAELSALGYALNGNNRAKSGRKKEVKTLCEWCNKEITVPVENGFTCPCCGVYFESYEPQKARIDLSQKELAYEERYDELTVIERIRRGEWGLEKTNLKSAAQMTMM